MLIIKNALGLFICICLYVADFQHPNLLLGLFNFFVSLHILQCFTALELSYRASRGHHSILVI